LRRTSPTHLYADTAEREDLRRLLAIGGGILAEIDGNTVNQPLARRVLGRYLLGARLDACADKIRRHSERALLTMPRATVCSESRSTAVASASAAS
jgi:hypothetical protein